jgi:ankyrin repeat protein
VIEAANAGGIMTTRAEPGTAEEYGHGHTPLMRAALAGNTERVKELIHQGADINRRDDNGRTALMFAVINTHYETMKVLLEYGADVNARSNQGGTALMGSALAGDLRMVQALLDKGADLHARLPETDQSALTFATSHGYDEIARLLSRID